MKYAIISDIHGNYPALRAVLKDAEGYGAEKYIFLGDFTNSLPFQNEVVDAVRALPNVTAIRGNHEDYLIEAKEIAPDAEVPGMYLPILWSCRRHSPGNLDYLVNLPANVRTDEGLFLSHSMDLIFRRERMQPFHSDYFRERMTSTPFTHEEYLQFAAEEMRSCEDVMAEVRALPKAVHLFGHNHLQFHVEIEGRLFLNPGSCGFSLNSDTRAAYTILEITNKNRSVYSITERRVDYDLTEVLDAIEASGFAGDIPEWTPIMTKQLQIAFDCFAPFVNHMTSTAEKLGIENHMDNAVWREAVSTYEY